MSVNAALFEYCNQAEFQQHVNNLIKNHREPASSNTNALRSIIKEQAARISARIFSDFNNVTLAYFKEGPKIESLKEVTASLSL